VYEVAKPTIIEATLDTLTNTVKLVWTISDTTGVVKYIASSSDSSDFYSGNWHTIDDNVVADSLVYSVNDDYPLSVTPLTVYFNVSAVVKTDELNFFVGPKSDIVSKKVR
jgi:hypothetical protein